MKKHISKVRNFIISNILLLLVFTFLIVHQIWLDNIQKKHYLSADIEAFEEKAFYNILTIEIIILIIAIIWQLKKSSTLAYLYGIFLYTIVGVLTFYYFQKAYSSTILPLNRQKIVDIKSYQFKVVSVKKDSVKGTVIGLRDLKNFDSRRIYFEANDTLNYDKRDTILLKFKVGKFGLRFDPTNELNTFKRINPY
tara:strand:+ start:3983 stop:4567 length:585 start_codon:yes stop_codon:yes gene_type:complete